LQANEGLLGEIDEDKTGNGKIVCKDGFTATTFTPDQFQQLVNSLGRKAEITEVDESVLFCVIAV
jgi:2-polyprenyl-6-hydroxyphenyl methylase/3-demethylubiquinone-9 3-methyltransferase